jgi:hypothetical protein
MQVFNEEIPKEKFNDWHLILCQTKGSYIREPIVLNNSVIVCYEPGDYQEQVTAWSRINTPIKEIRRDQTWRKFARRIMFSRF